MFRPISLGSVHRARVESGTCEVPDVKMSTVMAAGPWPNATFAYGHGFSGAKGFPLKIKTIKSGFCLRGGRV